MWSLPLQDIYRPPVQPSDAFDQGLDEAAANAEERQPLVVDLDGYEGPLDVLLVLARGQKVDLARISILQLAEQYLAFIEQIRGIKLEVAADYLVMAAWLAYLKSRLLLPPEENGDEELSGPEMAARLAFQLQRLQAMRDVSAKLMARDRLGRDVFSRGAPEGIRVIRKSVYQVSLFELLKAYGDFKLRGKSNPLTMRTSVIHSIEEAVRRLERVLGKMPNWTRLESFLPQSLSSPAERRSAVASTFAATLELVKRGDLRLRQGEAFGPLYLMGNAAATPITSPNE
ncbi:MAG: segregation/condensation protein A [Alphaproteobacteria bacterium]|nr:segregation/condensation protein A [Alphaproteobacteria bacterium]